MSHTPKDFNNLASNEKWALSYSIRRLNGLPKFTDEIFTSLNDLQDYVRDCESLVYDGQVFRVVDQNLDVTFYYAKHNGSGWDLEQMDFSGGISQADLETALKGFIPKKTLVILKESDFIYDSNGQVLECTTQVQSNHLYVAEINANQDPNSPWYEDNVIKMLRLTEEQDGTHYVDNTLFLFRLQDFNNQNNYMLDLANGNIGDNFNFVGAINTAQGNAQFVHGDSYMVKYTHGIHTIEQIYDCTVIDSNYKPDNIIEP